MQLSSGNMSPRAARNLQDRFTSHATTKISLSGQVRWVGYYDILTLGSNAELPDGSHKIQMPADGQLVPVSGAASRAVVAATAGSSVDTGGILLNSGDSLYYRIPYGIAAATVDPTNFLIVPTAANTNGISPFSDSEDWVMVARRNDQGVFTLGTGDVAGLCAQIGYGDYITSASWQAMKQRAMGSGYFFSPGGNTASPGAFGFTGPIRWTNGGERPAVNASGYVDAGDRAVGLAVKGVNGAADRAWRLMTSAEKPTWFGGMQRGLNPIVPASTTVLDLQGNEALYYVPNIDIGGAAGQWVVSGYIGSLIVPVHWLPVASRQLTGSNNTIQVLVGGVQYALKAGDARYTTSNDATMDAVRRTQNVQFNGLGYCRFTTATFFSGANGNGSLEGTSGAMVSWDDSRLMYGMSDGYASFGNQYTFLNVPTAGTAIPVVNTNSNVTRIVQTIGAHRYIPLGNWEALFWIPPANIAGGTSSNGDWVISYYGAQSQCVPPSAVLVAKMFSSPMGSSDNKTRVMFADGSYLQPGSTLATALFAEYDHAQGSGDWRLITVAGGTAAERTAPGMTAPLTATAGVSRNYFLPFTSRFRYVTSDADPRGYIELEGIVELNNDVADNALIAFLPGVAVRGAPIVQAQFVATALLDAKPMVVQLRFQNATINGSSGVTVTAGGGLTIANPMRTLGTGGGASPAGTPIWVAMGPLTLPHN